MRQAGLKFFLMTAGLALAALLVGCSDDEIQRATVTVKVSVCMDAGADCYSLGVPSAKVELKARDGSVVVTSATDDTGVARFEVPDGFQGGQVVARSTLLEGGQAVGLFNYPSADNGVTMMGKLASTAGQPVATS